MNLRGSKAKQLVQGIELNSQSDHDEVLDGAIIETCEASSPGKLSPLRKNKYHNFESPRGS